MKMNITRWETAPGYYDAYHEGRCPAGISTQDPQLAKNLDPETWWSKN